MLAARGFVQKEPGEPSSTDRGGERVVGELPDALEIDDDRLRRLFDEPAVGIPAGKVANGERQGLEYARVDRGGRLCGRALRAQERGRLLKQLHQAVRLFLQQLDEEIIGVEFRQRRQAAQSLGAAVAAEARRQPSLDKILIGEIGGRRIDDGGPRDRSQSRPGRA